MTRPYQGEPFFFYYACLMLVLVAGAFESHALVNPQKLPPWKPLTLS